MVWWNTSLYPGLKDQHFAKPSQQIVFHEDFDFHYKRLKDQYPLVQPTLQAVYADFHARKWQVKWQQNGPVPNSLYDPNWFYYVNGVSNNGGQGVNGKWTAGAFRPVLLAFSHFLHIKCSRGCLVGGRRPCRTDGDPAHDAPEKRRRPRRVDGRRIQA